MSDNEISEFVRTLFASGFDVISVDRKPNFILVSAERSDEFGLATRYKFAYGGKGRLSIGDRHILEKIGRMDSSSVIFVSESSQISTGYLSLTRQQFFGKVGGAVSSVLALEPDYGSRVTELGFNRRPPDLNGEADDLFEAYVHAGLQFLLRGRVIRYGQERRGEAVSDGVVVGRNIPLMLYDCKAASKGYQFSMTTIRQFADYVNDFHSRYEQSVGRLHAFLTVSSKFENSNTLHDRSNQLYGKCSIPLVCLRAKDLAQMVSLFSQNIAFRNAVDWREMFAPPVVRLSAVQKLVQARVRDKVLRGK